MMKLYDIIVLAIGLIILGCSTETIVDRVDDDICPVTKSLEATADTVVISEADTTQVRYPIQFTINVNGWQ